MSKEKSILIVGNFLSNATGTRGVCEDFAERLADAGWNIVATSKKPGRVMRLLDMLNTVWKERRQYQLASIDAFSGLSFVWAEIVASFLSRLGKPYILILHGGNLPDFARRQPGRVARLLQSARAVTAPSAYLQEQMKAYRSDIKLIPNPIDILRYSFVCRDAPEPTLVWLRAFHNIYNPPLAIFVAALLSEKYPELRLLMGGGDKGDGSLQNAKRQAAKLHISPQIEFANKIPNKNVPSWLQNGDIFLNTTNYDNTPVSVLEAMACGLCVVSTNVGGIPYLLNDGTNALLVPPNDPNAMATAVLRLLTEPGLSRYLSENGRKLVEQYDWRQVYPLWANLFKNVSI